MPDADLQTEISKSTHRPFRRAYIRRRSNTTGLYETDWYEITDYIIKWGKLHTSVDEIKINEFKHSGVTIVCKNNEGKFNPEYNSSSLWYGYMTRYRTLLKITGGYYKDANLDGTQLPTTPTLGVFILTDDVIIDGTKNTATLKFRSIMSVFNEVKAKDIPGLGTINQTAKQLIEKIRDATDGSTNFIFQQFISSAAWAITSSAQQYNLATTTTIGDKSCWDIMNILAESEAYILLINRTGGFEFRSREYRTTVAEFVFYGQGFNNCNVIQLVEYSEPISKFYNYIRMKFLEADTETSYAIAGTVTTVDPSTSAWKYGTRTMELTNEFISTSANALTVVNNLRTEFGEIREELKIIAKFCPQLEISDKTTFNYHSYSLSYPDNSSYFDMCNFAINEDDSDETAIGTGYFDEGKGENFDWDNVPFKIISKHHDLDKFTTEFILRKI